MIARAAALAAAAATAVTLGSGCTLLPENPGRTWYQLQDASVAKRHSAASATADAAPGEDVALARRTPPDAARALVVGPLQTNALYGGTGIVYGRDPGIRSTYQYAVWTEAPARRLIELIDARLNARDPVLRRFATVTTESSGVKADWLLGVRVLEFYHDTTGDPDRAVVEVDAELVDWRSKSLLDRRRFRVERPLSTEDVDGAVAALGTATSTLLDRLTAWLDAIAARAGPR
ncbi:MAG: ABC-type transport auxiliary lipoprotein family protein [Lautropia sp.]